jgi:hypothetical protein
MYHMPYYVETYGGDGCYADPAIVIHGEFADALADVSGRLGRSVTMAPDWMPEQDLSSAQVPSDARPVGAWHESDRELCGGAAIWRVD